MQYKKQTIIYGCVVLLALALRAYSPIPIDLIGDDATYAFRSVGYFDHMASQLQTTPSQWFEAVPWWAKLSFHDHPPAAFLFFHIFFSLFGMTSLVAHAIPVLLGTLSVALCIAVGVRLGSPRIGIIAGILYAITSLSLWISRLLYLETLLIPLLLFTLYSALRASTSPRWWLVSCFAIGAAINTKYTAVFLIPALVFLLYLSRPMKKWMVSGISAFVAILIPVIIYNIAVYQTRGHFDFQLTRLLHISTADWPRLTAASAPHSILGIFSGLQTTLSYPAFILFLAAAGWSLVQGFWQKKKIHIAFTLIIFSFALETMFLGNVARFLSPLVPFLSLSAALFIHEVMNGTKGKILITFLLLCAFVTIVMGVYTINTHYSINPWGRAGITYSSARGENYGYEQLDQYLHTLYQNRNSVNDLWDASAVDKTLYIFDSNINYFPKMWYIQRRVTYQGIPFASSLEFRRLIQENGEGYFPRQGYAHYVFIHALPGTLRVPEDIINDVADNMAFTLEEQGIMAETISRSDGTPAFHVFLF